MTDPIPARISADGRTATWNPALTRAQRVCIEVLGSDGTLGKRATMNSGRAKVREGERIQSVRAEE
jgi:hypothetical protein